MNNITNAAYMPNVIETSGDREKSYDLLSRLMEDSIILINGEINDDTAMVVTSQLLYLTAKDADKPIQIFINSPGGSVTAGLAIMDIMKAISNPIYTICMGLAASMGAFLLSCGDKGKRICLPHAEVMIHQPLGGTKGQATEIQIMAEHILHTKQVLNEILAENTGRDIELIAQDTERDKWLTAEDAKNYGLVDKVIASLQEM